MSFRPVTIDMHCHLMVPEVDGLVAEYPEKRAEPELTKRMMGAASAEANIRQIKDLGPRLTNPNLRLELMEKMGVDIQVVSPSPGQYYNWADPDLAAAIVEKQNESIAALCQRFPARLMGLAAIAPQHPELAVRQLNRAVGEFGLRGVEISTSISVRDLADASLEPLWARAAELGCVVFIHPWGTSLGERLDQYYFANIIGQPIETTIALSYLIFGGVLDRRPGLKICAAHGGGYLPCYSGRADHAYSVRPESKSMARPPGEYLRQIYFDTVLYSPEAVEQLIRQVGLSQVVIGTDYPFDMGRYDPHGLVSHLGPAEREAILGGNARRLLGIEGVPSDQE